MNTFLFDTAPIPGYPLRPEVALIPGYTLRLGECARRFRATCDDSERRRIATDYAATVDRLIGTGAWDEMPPPEDQLPLDWMPGSFFVYWSPPEPVAPPAPAHPSRVVG